MWTVILASATSVLFGVGDFLGGFASRKDSAIAVTANAHVVALAAFAVALFAFPAAFSRTAVLAGAFSGIAGGIGVVALYAALARGRMSVVAPITAALSGSLPAAFDMVRGTRVGTTAVAGLVLALVATVIVSAAPAESAGDAEEFGLGDAVGGPESHPQAMPPAALGLSLLAGACFAASLVAFSLSGKHSGFWPLFSARVVSVSLLGAAALVRRGHFAVDATARRATLGAGLFDAAANVTMVSAIRLGPLAVATVIGSLYPVVTIMLARGVLHERMTTLQKAGVALAMVAVVMTALP